MRNPFIRIAVAMIAVVVVGGIVTVIVYATRATPPTALTQPAWTLTTLVEDAQEQALSSSHPATLRFDAHDSQITGSGGCNMFGGAYTLNAARLQFSELRSTLIGCLDPVVSGQESHYLQALSQVTTYRLEGNMLTLSDDSGRVQLTFRAS